jgi:hypothetical protein
VHTLESPCTSYILFVLDSAPSPCVFIPWLHCTDFDIVQILMLATVDIQGKPHHRPRGTLRFTNRNRWGVREGEHSAYLPIDDAFSIGVFWQLRQ